MVPINADGSIYFQGPSGRALYFQVLDKDKRLIRSMRTFIQAAPGTVRSCIGCHEKKTNTSARPVNLNRRVLAGKPAMPKPESWGTGYMDFPSMVQPILDRRCVKCHGGEKGIEARLDLSGGWTEHFTIGYENLADRRETQLTAYLISGIDCMNGTAHWSARLFAPRSHGSAVAPMAKAIASGHKKRIKGLTETERDLLMAWIDSNRLYYGTWDYTAPGYQNVWRGVRNRLSGEMAKAGCMKCHDRYFANDWFNLRSPEYSRILRAPLAKGKKGFGLEICLNHKVNPARRRIRLLRNGYAHAVQPLQRFAKQPIPPLPEGGKPEPTFASTDNPHYQAMLDIIRQGRLQALAKPRVDMPGADVIAGKSRMLLPPPVPKKAPEPRASVDARVGMVHLSWERSARTIGLEAQVHRSSKKDFIPVKETQLTQTLLAHHVDKKAPSGTQYYALILLSGSEKSTPARICVTVPSPPPPTPPAGVEATGAVGRVQLRWKAGGAGVRYHVYRAVGGSDKFKRITTDPTAKSRYDDAAVSPGVKHSYTVRTVNIRNVESAASPPVKAAAMPEIKAPLFVAALTKNTDAALYGGKKARGRVHGKAKIAAEGLDLRNGGYVTFDHRPEFDLTRRFSLVCRVKIAKPTKMPVIVSCGEWKKAGWYLQRLLNGWRWHLGGVDCDGGRPMTGKWTELIATFDGQTACLYQDGKLVARTEGNVNRTVWPGPLYLGQYGARIGSEYQVNGWISNLRIYGRSVTPKDIQPSP